MAGWDPVPLALIFSAAGMPLVTMIQLELPPGAFLPPGCAPGDEVRLPLPNLDFDLMLVVMEVSHRRGGDAKMQQQSSDGDDDDLWDSPPKNDGDAKLIATFITVALGGYSLILAYDGYLNGFYLFGKCLYAGANSGGWS